MGKHHCLELKPVELLAAAVSLSALVHWTDLLLTGDQRYWPLQQAEQPQPMRQCNVAIRARQYTFQLVKKNMGSDTTQIVGGKLFQHSFA